MSDARLLSASELEDLKAVGLVQRFDTDDRLISLGAQSSEVFFLLEGLVKIVVVSATGVESVFGVRRPGELVGEMSTLNDERRSADVVAIEPTTAVMVSANQFIGYLESHPSVAVGLLRMQSKRLNEMTLRAMRVSRSVMARIALRLTELSQGSDDPNVVELTQDELAKYVDATREWTSKALGELRRRGAIETGRGRVHIVDHGELYEATLEA